MPFEGEGASLILPGRVKVQVTLQGSIDTTPARKGRSTLLPCLPGLYGDQEEWEGSFLLEPAESCSRSETSYTPVAWREKGDVLLTVHKDGSPGSPMTR